MISKHQMQERPTCGGKAKGKRQKAKGKNYRFSTGLAISSPLQPGNSFLPFAFCLRAPHAAPRLKKGGTLRRHFANG
jgi:hypothetical protein